MSLKLSPALLVLLISVNALAQPTITTDSVIQTGTCAGSAVLVRYKTSGGSFSIGNSFKAQLSNAFGQFTAPVDIGSTNFNFGIILATLPRDITFGFLYRIRVVSTNPAITGSPSPNTVFVTSTPLTATIAAPNGTSLCPGDSLTLQAMLPNATYQWSTGATTQSIKVSNAGSYWVKVKDPLGCEARDTVVITTKAGCVLSNGTVSMYPNPTPPGGLVILRGVAPGSSVQLVDLFGRTTATLIVGGNNHIRLPHMVAPGVYLILTTSNDKKQLLGKLVVLN